MCVPGGWNRYVLVSTIFKIFPKARVICFNVNEVLEIQKGLLWEVNLIIA